MCSSSAFSDVFSKSIPYATPCDSYPQHLQLKLLQQRYVDIRTPVDDSIKVGSQITVPVCNRWEDFWEYRAAA